MAIIPKLPFPNIPKLPGVPQLARNGAFPASPGPVLGAVVAIGRLWKALTAQPTWGIFKQVPPPKGGSVTAVIGGVEVTSASVPTPLSRDVPKAAVDADSVLSFSYKNEVTIADFPIQDGGFANYDRVSNPYEASVRLSKGGSKADRQKFLQQIEDVIASMDLFYILTPEKTYQNVSCTRFELIRTEASGAYFLTGVDLYFREIRSVTQQYTNTAVTTQNAQLPSAEPVTNSGTVQGQPVDAIDIQGVTP